MATLDALQRSGRCPQDGARLHGSLDTCPHCGSNWRPLLEGTATSDHRTFGNGDGDKEREYIRRRAHALANPNAMMRRAMAPTTDAQHAMRSGAHSLVRSVDTPVYGRSFNPRRLS